MEWLRRAANKVKISWCYVHSDLAAVMASMMHSMVSVSFSAMFGRRVSKCITRSHPILISALTISNGNIISDTRRNAE